MATKNLQFIVTVAVDVPDDWECPSEATDAIQGDLIGAVDLNALPTTTLLGANKIIGISAEFETITD